MIKLYKGAYIGLDIGFHSIKIVEIAPGKKAHSVKRLIVVPTGNSPSMSEEEIAARTSEILKTAWKEHKIRAKRVHSVIPGGSVFYRPLRIPLVTGDRLEKIVRYEAKQQIPFPMDQVLLHHHIFGGSGGELEGALIAVKRDTIDDHVKMLAKAGLRPDYIDVSTLSLFNSTRAIEREEDEVIAIVNIGARRTDIIIEHNNVLKFCRSASAGGNDLTHALHTTLDRSFEECEDLKVRFASLSSSYESRFSGLPHEWQGGVDETTVSSTLDNAFERIVREVRLSIDFYISQPDGMPVNRLLITGGSSALPGVVEFFEERLGIPVEKLDPLESCPADLSAAIDESNSALVMVAGGVAVPANFENRISMNFIPDSIYQGQEFEKKLGYLIVQGAFAVVMVGLAFAYLSRYTDYRERAYLDMKGVVDIDKRKIGEKLTEYLGQQKEMRNRFRRLRDISEIRGKVMKNLLEIVKISPEKHVSITELEIYQDHMRIEGKAFHDEGVKSFAEKLNISPFVGAFKINRVDDVKKVFVFNVSDMQEPSEKGKAFYPIIWERRQEIPNLRSFRFGTKKKPGMVIFRFEDADILEDLCRQFSVALSALVESNIEYKAVRINVEDFIGDGKYSFLIKDSAEVMKLHHGEKEMTEFVSESLAASKGQES